MSKKTLISVIMPVYNAEEYLHDSIGSILSQDVDNYELILINDGSTDGSLDIIKEYEKKYDNIRVITKKNTGILKTRLEGVKYAKGEYILFVDADDKLPVNTLNIYTNYLKKKKCDIIRGNYEKITNRGNIKKIEFNEIKYVEKQDYTDEVYVKYLTTPIFNSIWRTLIKKDLLKLYADVQISMGEDQAFMISILNRSRNILLIPDFVYYYRTNNTSTTNLKNVNKKCKNFDELYSLYLNIIIPFFKEIDNEILLKKAYSKYLRDMNMLFYEIYKLDNTKELVKEYQDKLFNSGIIIELRKVIDKNDIKEQKTYMFIKPILMNNKTKHLKMMKLLGIAQKIKK